MADVAEKIVLEGDPDPRELEQLQINQREQMFDALDKYRTAFDQSTGRASAPQPAQSPTDPLIQQSQQDLQDYRAATQREVDAKRKQAEAMAPEYQKYIDQSRAYRENPLERPQVPNLPAQPPTLQQQVNPTAAKSLFAVASMMAALSMAGGRGRGMLAMAGMTGAIQGFNEGNFLKYKTGMETYKTAVDTQIQQYNMQVKDYTLQMNERHANLEDMFRELNLQAHKYGDDVMIAETEAGRLDGILKRTADIARFSNDAQKVVRENELFPYRRDLLQAQTEKAQAEAQRGPKLSTEEQKIMLARRAQGETTGDPNIDALQPEVAKKMAGLEPKPSAAQTKARDQLIGTSNVLKEIEALIPEMDKKGFLAKSEGRIPSEAASLRRWMNPSDPTLAKWKSLQGSIVGFDRSVFNDVGARIKSAFEGSLELFDKPYTKEGLTQAIQGYRRILEDSPEAKRALAENPEALSGGGPRGPMPGLPAGGQMISGKIMVRRKSDGQPGMISEQNFDPAKYEKIPEGVPVQ